MISLTSRDKKSLYFLFLFLSSYAVYFVYDMYSIDKLVQAQQEVNSTSKEYAEVLSYLPPSLNTLVAHSKDKGVIISYQIEGGVLTARAKSFSRLATFSRFLEKNGVTLQSFKFNMVNGNFNGIFYIDNLNSINGS